MNRHVSNLTTDPLDRLRRLTPARVGLGRAGGSVRTCELLKFQLAHAEARDAVHEEFDALELEKDLSGLGHPVVQLESAAGDRASYLLRPDLGRVLAEESVEKLRTVRGEECDVSIVLSDGLSALAAHRQTPAVMAAFLPLLKREGLVIGPIAIVRLGRVAVQDQVGEILGARVSVILLGERPGLLSADSLGAYLVFGPRVGRTDADRNCVSNIRGEGLAPEEAAGLIHYLMVQSLRRGISGVGLKDERGASQLERSPHPNPPPEYRAREMRE